MKLIFTWSILVFTTTTTIIVPLLLCNNGVFVEATNNVTDPLIYQRLRFDHDYLQIYRRFQKHLAEDETKYTIRVNVSAEGGAAKEIKFTYYKNYQFDSKSITQDDLIFEALDRAYRTRLIPVFVHNYDKQDDRKRAGDPRKVSASRCEQELNYLVDQMRHVQKSRVDSYQLVLSPELAAFFDSYGSEEPGLLLGNYHWPGNWKQCGKRQIFHLDQQNLTNSIQFRGRYCMASIRSRRWQSKILERQVELRKNHFKYANQEADYSSFFRIQIGVCLPESCDSHIIESRREDIRQLATLRLGEPLRSYQLADLYCLPDETSDLRKIEPSGRLFLVVASAWCLLLALATLLDYTSTATGGAGGGRHSRPDTKQQVAGPTTTRGRNQPLSFRDKFVTSLSLFRNYHRLVETQSLRTTSAATMDGSKSGGGGAGGAAIGSGAAQQASVSQSLRVRPLSERNKLSPNDLLFLNAIKVISMPLILFGHVGMLFKHLDRYVLDYEALESDFIFHFQASTPFFVDWFFAVSGFLTTYLMFVTRKVEFNSPLHWAYTIFHRYWRLAPIYLLLFWYAKSLFMYTSYGPLWDYGTTNMTLRSICRRESWLYALTLTSNLHPLHESCIMPGWYIACDMQYFLLTPFILVLLHKSPLLGWLVTLSTIVACVSLRLHRYLTDPRAQPLELMRPRYDLYMRNNWDMHPTYVYPQYRVATYLIGILAGHYTYMVLSGKWRSPLYPGGAGGGGTGSGSGSGSSGNKFKFSPWLRLAGWLVGCQLLVSMMFATWLISDLFPVAWERQVRYFTAVIYALDHSLAGSGMALFMVTTMFGQFEWLRRFMSRPLWTVLSRVNFVAFLIQVEIINWLLQSADRTVEMSTLEAFKVFLYLSCLTYLFAAILTVLLEFPLAQLERQFVGVWFAGSSSSGAKRQQAKQHCELSRIGNGGGADQQQRQEAAAAAAACSSESSQLVGPASS